MNPVCQVELRVVPHDWMMPYYMLLFRLGSSNQKLENPPPVGQEPQQQRRTNEKKEKKRKR
jgi:hypothetical protein